MRLADIDLTIHYILSEQYTKQPEMRLLWAILKRWLLDYTGICGGGTLEARFDAIEWAWEGGNEEWGFTWICDQIGLDAEWVRRSADKIATEGLEPGSLGGRLGTLEI